ncbi:FecR family protein [Achromobacter denitrificans]|uniref:FecR family protein n=2 Tax=Achromobacter denitrificans TaxID=32002 RepID=UPI0009E8CDAA|nr:FecR family protein [Achromobacter denitrificans]QKH41333.1 FecR domain-containing protein [Achromobacter denitrificans]QKH51523.1 FecR domain-containing protein [Achromobacter denitrificans]
MPPVRLCMRKRRNTRLPRVGRRPAAGAAWRCRSAGWLSVQHQSQSAFAADVHTAPGQWRTPTLADGNRLALGSGSAVNYRQDGSRRELELVQGELLVDVAKDPARPFTVVTAEARITVLGTRFAVERHDRRQHGRGAGAPRSVRRHLGRHRRAMQFPLHSGRLFGTAGRIAPGSRDGLRALRGAPSSSLCLALRPSYSVAAAGSPRSAESRYRLRARASGKRMSR